MNRRDFLKATVAAATSAGVASLLDWDAILWVPGEKSIFLPPPVVIAETMADAVGLSGTLYAKVSDTEFWQHTRRGPLAWSEFKSVQVHFADGRVKSFAEMTQASDRVAALKQTEARVRYAWR